MDNIKYIEPIAKTILSDEEGIIQDCYNIDGINYKFLIPQLLKQDYITRLETLIKSSTNPTKVTKCLKFLKKLKIKASIIKYATDNNTNIICKQETDSFMYLIHTINNTFNKLLQNPNFKHDNINLIRNRQYMIKNLFLLLRRED